MNRKLRWVQGLAIMLAVIVTFLNCDISMALAAGNQGSKQKLQTVNEKKVKKHRSNSKTDLIVKYKDQSERTFTTKNVKSNSKAAKLNQKRYFKKQRIGVYEVNASDDLDTIIEEFENDPNVVYAQPNYPLTVASAPTDDQWDKQWGLHNDEQEVNGYTGRAGVDINAVDAWNQRIVNNDIVIGILDTGIDSTHKDLAGCIYTNTKEIPGNGIDDDNNGYIDDIHGWDFSNDDASIYDSAITDAHGTYVAGIIAASANNGGIAGTAPGIKVMPLKFIHGNTGYTSDAIEAIEYAVNMGVKIINCSFGGTDDNQALQDAMANSGILFVCAAGNRGDDTAVKPVYPAAFDINNVISVAAIDSKGLLPSFSSYGCNVDVAAPGTSIISTKPDNDYDYFSGTSVSAAFVTGVAALIETRLSDQDILSMKNRIMNTVTPCDSLSGLILSGGRVDAYAALTGMVQAADSYTGQSNTGDILPGDGDGEADTWYVMNELGSNAERFHYGEGGVNPASGNYSLTCSDMKVETPGFTVEISRTYNSRNQKQTLLGRGWTFGFEGKVTNKTNSVEISLPNGSCHVFRLINGIYKGEGTRAKFERNVNGADILTTTDQYQYGFDLSTHKLIYMKDKNQNRINLTYTGGKLTTITDTAAREYSLSYNNIGLLESVTDPAGRIVTYEYNSNNLLEIVTDPEGGAYRYEYDNSQFLAKQYQKQKEEKEILFQEIEYSHSFGAAENKVIQTKDASGETWNYSYDMMNSSTTITNNADKKWTYWFDYFMYTVKVQDPEGKSTSTTYNYKQELDDEEKEFTNYFGDVTSRIDRNGNRTEYEIDVNTGNTTKVTSPDGGVSSYVYDAWNNVIEEVNEAESKTYYIYDANGANLLKKVQPLDGTAAYVEGNTTDFSVTSYAYYTKSEADSLFGCNAAGLLKAETDPEGNTVSYTYDQYGNIASKKDAAGNTTVYTYDSIGQKLSETTAEGDKTNWNYNKNGQVIREIHPDQGIKRTTYDMAGNVLLEVSPEEYDPQKDNLTTGSYTGTAGTSYEWYDNGCQKAVIDAAGNRTEYTWDQFGNKETEKKPNGSSYHYEYDSMNRLIRTYFTESSAEDKILLSEISYDALDNGNTQTTTIFYASDSKKTRIVTITDYAGREVLVQYGDNSRTKTVYNPEGTVKQTTAANGAITYYNYDKLGNLTAEWKPVSVANGTSWYTWTEYTYDRSGKLIAQKTGTSLVPLYETTEAVYTKYYTYLQGQMKQETDSEGRKTIYTYDRDGRVKQTTQSVTSSSDQITQYEYNYLGNPVSITTEVRSGDIAGNSFEDDTPINLANTYHYDLNGNLISTTDAEGNVTSYTYDAMNRLLTTTTQWKDAEGTLLRDIVTSKTYNWEGKVTSETDANGNTTAYTYDAYGNQTGIRDANGNTTVQYYNRAGNVTAVVSPENYKENTALSDMERTEYSYDDLGRVQKQTELYQKMELDENFEWTKEWVSIDVKTYQYDALGNITAETDALGNTRRSEYNLAGLLERVIDAETGYRGYPYTVQYSYNGLGQKVKEEYLGATYEYSYDGAGNLLSTTVNSMTRATASYDLLDRAISTTDGRGNITTQSWNSLGKVSKVNTPGDTSIAANTTINQYDKSGNLLYSEDSLGTVTAYTYDNLGRNLSKTITDAADTNRVTTSTAYDANGNVVLQKDGNGKLTTFTYDALNQVEASTNALGQKTEYAYDANKNLIQQKDYLGNTTTKVYDGINRLVEVRDAYDNIVQQILYNDANAQVSSYDALHHQTRYLYDKNLRQAGIIDGEGNTSLTDYDARGNIKSKTDGSNHVTQYKYDGENRLIGVIDALGNKTNYTYDGAGNLISQTDGNGNTTTYQYNSANLVTAKLDPEGSGNPAGTETYTYYANKLMAAKTDRNGIVTAYTYDALGRLVTEDAGGELQSYTYDANGNLLTMTDASGTTTRTYDALNRNITKTVPLIGTSIYEYDLEVQEAGGYAERTTDPKGNINLKTYDRVGRLKAVTVGEETTTYEYYQNGSRSRITYPDGTTEHYNYNANNQITELINAKADGTVISSYQYTYDSAGNQLTKTEEKGTTTYTYDYLNRLSTVTEPNGKETSYTYDGAGNRKTETVQQGMTGSQTIYTYNSQNRLTSTAAVGGSYTKYLYDKNGNLISKTTGKMDEIKTKPTSEDLPQFSLIIKRGSENGTGSADLTLYTYDHYNRLTGYKKDHTSASYQYNAQGYRVQKTVNGSTTNYLYETDKVVLETDGSNEQKAVQVYGSALLYRSVAGSKTESYYYLYNAHGDVTSLIDANGNLAATYDYDAFGNMISETGSADNYIKYAGYQKDDENGLYYLNARYYDSVTARFITEDTYTGEKNDPLSLNLYTYCQNNPIIYTDPSGHVSKPVSVVDYMKSQGLDSSYAARSQLAKDLGIKDYKGTAKQNGKILDFVMAVTAPKASTSSKNNGGTTSSKAETQKTSTSKVTNQVNNTNSSNISTSKKEENKNSTPVNNGDLVLTDEMKESGVTLTIIEGKQYYDYSSSINATFHDAGEEASVHNGQKGTLKWFKSMVNHKADWDIKREEPWDKTVGAPYPGSYDTVIVVNDKLTTPEELGNMMYGYTGIAAGISEPVLIGGSMYAAGIWNIIKNKDARENEFKDHEAIRKGIKLYKDEKNLK